MAELAKQGGGGRLGSRWRIAIWGGAALLLALPLIAMQFTREVVWGPVDFAVFGAMLAAACGAWELAARTSGNIAYRAAAGVAIAAAFLTIWANLAVGMIGDEDNPINLMFAGVLAFGLPGAVMARFRPQGMAYAMAATGAAQLLAATIGLVSGLDLLGSALSACFALPWLASAWLFGKAARR
jgi:hypothetical protein